MDNYNADGLPKLGPKLPEDAIFHDIAGDGQYEKDTPIPTACHLLSANHKEPCLLDA
jgi:hypothetical protein